MIREKFVDAVVPAPERILDLIVRAEDGPGRIITFHLLGTLRERVACCLRAAQASSLERSH
jgi:hypothetical protein